MQRWGAVPATEPGTPTLRSSAPGPNLFAWPGHADLTHIRDEITGEIAVLLFGIPLGKKGEKQSRRLHSSTPGWVSTPNSGDSLARSGLSIQGRCGGPGRPLLGSDGGADVGRASALASVGDALCTVPFPARQSVEPRLKKDHRICEGRSARNPYLI